MMPASRYGMQKGNALGHALEGRCAYSDGAVLCGVATMRV